MSPRWTAWKLAISAFVTFHCCATIAWVIPDSALKHQVAPWFRTYMLPLGLWQSWSMFAPNPVATAYSLEAEVADSRGMTRIHEFVKTADLPWLEKSIQFRHSKFPANLANDEYQPQRVMVARHAARVLEVPPDAFPIYVRLYYQVSQPPPFGSSASDPMEPRSVTNLAEFQFDSWNEVHRR